ncbi:MAG: glycosyltransferase [Candidatus Levybacteria bacterium]|nr:glycosyltransferase [Candidatus Levybacteria bacterium]
MKIGIFDPYFDDLGGGEKYMMTVAQCLASNHNVDVFWDNNNDVEELKRRFSFNLSRINFAKNIFSPKVSTFRRLLITKKYDVIILLSDGSIPITLSKKTFIHFQQPISELRLNFKDKFKIKKITKFFCNSKYTKSYIDRSLNIDSSILYPPVSLRPTKDNKENIILHVGRFRVRNVNADDYKKQGVMIEAFKEMIKRGLLNWKFVLAVSVKKNEEKIFNEFKKRTENFPIEFSINNTNDHLWNIYSKAKIYWHASGLGEDLLRHPEYAEHFGISTVEAMGAGNVPVVINAGGQKEIVEDKKNGFLWNTLEELIDKTKILTEDQDLWSKMSKEAIKRANFFGGDRFCSDLRHILEL